MAGYNHHESVDGYWFENEQQLQKAKRELEGVEFIRQKIDYSDSEKVLAIYNKILEGRMFDTPIGISFLKELQEYLQKDKKIDSARIPDVLVKNPTVKKRQDAPGSETAQHMSDEQPQEKAGASLSQNSKQKDRKNRRQQKENEKYIERFRISLIINLVLVAVIIALFCITMTSDNPNILNYENEVINKYEQWDQQLQEREKAVQEYEKKYGIQE